MNFEMPTIKREASGNREKKNSVVTPLLSVETSIVKETKEGTLLSVEASVMKETKEEDIGNNNVRIHVHLVAYIYLFHILYAHVHKK
jgi:hypothetical protein